MAWINVPQASGAQRASTVKARADARAEASESRNWYSIRNAASPDEAEMLIYDEVGGWFGATADEFVADLRQVTAPSLRVRINSPGGSVFEGLAIANALRAWDGSVTVQVDGLAASIASVIAMAGSRLIMMPNSMLMVHEASGLCMGDAAEMTKMAEVLGLISDNIADVYATKAGGTRDEWRATMRAETWYLPEDAVAAGLADEAVKAKPAESAADEPNMHARWDLTVYGYQGPKTPEKPKPGPPSAKAQTVGNEPIPATLTISLSDLLDDDTIARLRAAAEPAPVGVSAEPVGTGQDETAAGPDATPPEAPGLAAPNAALPGEHGPEPVALVPDPAVRPEVTAEPDEWAVFLADLTAPAADRWAAAFSHLTEPASSSATES